jgi:hypothetical protein
MATSEQYQKIQKIIHGKFLDVSYKSTGDGDSISYLRPGDFLKNMRFAPNYDRVRMVGILFAPIGAALTKNEIYPRIDEWYCRTGESIDFFCAGYSAAWGEDGEQDLVFDPQDFNEFRAELEQKTRWKYSGDVDLLLMNSGLDRYTSEPSIDFTAVIACCLDAMVRDGAIQSVGEFFESIFRFAEDHPNCEDPTWGFSDAMGIQVGWKALLNVVLSQLPEEVQKAFGSAKHFVVQDVSQASLV